MFDTRLQAKREGKSALQVALKLMMNGFYGSMGMKDFPKTFYVNKNICIVTDDDKD